LEEKLGRRGPNAPYVTTITELEEIVAAIQKVGAFSFDVETRGNISRNAEVSNQVETEWKAKQETLKSTHPTTLARSRRAIEERWEKQMALDPLRNEVFWIGLATKGMSWAVPMGHSNGEIIVPEDRGDGSTIPPEGHRDILASGKESQKKAKYFIPAEFTAPPEQLTQEQVFKVLGCLFSDESITKVNQNLKFDCKSITKYLGGVLPAGDYVDTQVLMHLIDEDMMNYRLGTIIARVFSGFDPYWRDGKVGATITTEPFSVATRYVHYDARWAWLLYTRLWRRIESVPTLMSALRRDIACMRPVAQMELNGIQVNAKAMKVLGKQLDMDINTLLMDISIHAFPGFNPDSNVDKQTLLFNKKRTPKDWDTDTKGEYQKGLGLTPYKLSEKTGKPSVDDKTMTKLKGKHPLIEMLMSYSEMKKLKSTYVDGLTPMLHSGRLHPQFHFHRTATGRFSSSDPNLQNIPRDSRVRSLFEAEKGNSLIVADYSQIEMRIMGMFSQDPELLRIFEEGIDVHTGTAALILGRDPEDSEERNIFGKTPNFLMGYGGGPNTLVEATQGAITVDEAKSIIERYDAGYAGWTAYKRRALHAGRKKGFVETMGGRRRRVPDLHADKTTQDGWKARMRAERQAINAIIQGTAAEFMKDAIIRLDRELPFPACRMLVQVHDEMVISVPTDQIIKWEPVIEHAMGNGTVINGVPIEVEAHHAGSWDEAKG